MDLISMLPLLKGWSYYTIDVDAPGFTVPAGQRKVIDEATKPGWVYSGMIHLKNKMATFEIAIFDPYQGRSVIRVQPAGMYAGGCISPNPVGPWLSRYDEATDDYVIIFSPSTLPPFSQRWMFSIIAPPDSSVQVVSFTGTVISIEQPDVFAQSLRELIAPTLTVEAIREMLRFTSPGRVCTKVEATA